MAIQLVKFNKLKGLLELDKSEAKYPDLATIKSSVVAAFEQHTGRIFTEGKYTSTIQVLDSPTKMIPLKAIPISSVVTVAMDGVGIEDYKIRSYGIQLGIPVQDVDITIIYKGGLDGIPSDLERAALLQTVYEYQNKNSIGLEVVNTPGGTVTKPQLGMLEEVEKLLSTFIHPFPRF